MNSGIREEKESHLESQLVVNKLPARTWNKLKVNEATVGLEGPVKSVRPVVTEGEVYHCGPSVENFVPAATGMGADLEHFLEEHQIPYTMVDASKQKEKEPVVLHYHYTEPGNYVDRLLIRAEDNLNIRVVLVFDSPDGLQGTSIHSVQVVVGENATVEICTVQMFGDSFRGLFDCGGVCLENGSLDLLHLQLGGQEIYAGGCGTLTGKNSHFQVETGYFGRNSQSLDFNFIARHQGRKTKSQMKAVGVLDHQARKIFRGTIDFQHGSVTAKGEETEDVLLLGEDVINQSVPIILCSEEDVDGTHGATIGKLDEQVLYYLACRGISGEDAKMLLAKSRINAICDHLPAEEVKRQVSAYMEAVYEKR